MAFMRDAQKVSRALSRVTGAVKMNYEIHGNSIPHLHLHFYPRHRGDRFEGRPIDPGARAENPYSPGEFEATRDDIVAALAKAGSAGETRGGEPR